IKRIEWISADDFRVESIKTEVSFIAQWRLDQLTITLFLQKTAEFGTIPYLSPWIWTERLLRPICFGKASSRYSSPSLWHYFPLCIRYVRALLPSKQN